MKLDTFKKILFHVATEVKDHVTRPAFLFLAFQSFYIFFFFFFKSKRKEAYQLLVFVTFEGLLLPHSASDIFRSSFQRSKVSKTF